MKKLGLLAVGVFCLVTFTQSALASAAGRSDHTLSPEERVFSAAQGRAIVEDRPVLIFLTASWCPPCFNIHEEFKKFPAEYAATFGKYEYHRLEDTWTNHIPYDFVGVSTIGFPSFYLWEPRTNQWTVMGGWIGKDILLGELERYREKRENYAVERWSRFLADVEAGKHFGTDDVHHELESLAVFVASAFPIDDVLEKYDIIVRLRSEHPEQFDFASDGEFFQPTFFSALQVYAGRAGTDLAKIREKYPLVITPELIQKLPVVSRLYYFDVPLTRTMREEGWSAASDACPSILADMMSHVEGTDETKATLKIRQELICSAIRFRVGQYPPSDYAAMIAAIPDAEKMKMPSMIWNAYLDLGEFASAAPFVQKDYELYLEQMKSSPGIVERIHENYRMLISAQAELRRNPNDLPSTPVNQTQF